MGRIDRIRVRIVYDDPIASGGLAAAFSRYGDLEVECHDGADGDRFTLLSRRGDQSTDVIVADYANGIEWAARAAREPYAAQVPKVLILANLDREGEIRHALACGVRGYVLMGCSIDDLAAGVRAVHRGERHLSPRVAARLAESLSVEPLTAREEEVLRLVVGGLCNKAIGKSLGIAVGTVKSHLKSTFDKLQVQSRTQAVSVVERRGLLRETPHLVRDRSGSDAAASMRMTAKGGDSHHSRRAA